MGTWHVLTNNIMLKTGRPYLLEIQNQQTNQRGSSQTPHLALLLAPPYNTLPLLCPTPTYSFPLNFCLPLLLLLPIFLSASPSTPSPTSLCLSFYSFPYFFLPLLLLLPLLLSASPSTPSPLLSASPSTPIPTSLCLSF
jgi:hypothetical protein